MITDKVKKALLESLHQMPVVEIACKKNNVSRSTFYRWRKESKEFAKAVEEALASGENLINDLSESQLIGLIKDRNFQAIHLWLRHHHPKYADKLKIEGKIIGEEVPLTKKELTMVRAALKLAYYTPHDKPK